MLTSVGTKLGRAAKSLAACLMSGTPTIGHLSIVFVELRQIDATVLHGLFALSLVKLNLPPAQTQRTLTKTPGGAAPKREKRIPEYLEAYRRGS